MAFDATDLANVEAAIVDLATGAREVEVTIGDKKVRYGEADLEKLQSLRTIIRMDLGTIYPRTYVKNAGRASC